MPPKNSPKPVLENIVLDESANGKITYGATDLERTRCIETRSLEGRYPRWRDVAVDPARVVRFDVDCKAPAAYVPNQPAATDESGDDSSGEAATEAAAPVEITSGDYAE